MKVVKDFNNISEELKPRPLGRDEVVIYRMLTGRPDPSRKDDKGNVIISYGKSVRIPTKDRIWDPYWKDSSGKKIGRFVDIGVVQEFTGDNVTKTVPFYATNGGDFINDGLIRLSGSNNRDAEIYEFFEISNYNKSFPYRSEDVEPIFERLDLEAENQRAIKVISKKADALTLAINMTLTEMREFCAQMNWNEIAEESVIKTQLLQFAESNPAKFLELYNDPMFSNKSTVKRAITADIIRYDPAQHRIVWGNTEQTIAILDRIDGKNHVELFADWLHNHKNGHDVRMKLESMLRGRTRTAMREATANREAEKAAYEAAKAERLGEDFEDDFELEETDFKEEPKRRGRPKKS